MSELDQPIMISWQNYIAMVLLENNYQGDFKPLMDAFNRGMTSIEEQAERRGFERGVDASAEVAYLAIDGGPQAAAKASGIQRAIRALKGTDENKDGK